MLTNTQNSYGTISKIFHWIIFLLALVMVFVGYFMGDIKDEALRGQVVNVHKMVGLAILVMMVLRAIWASFNTKPSLPGTPVWEKWAERFVHYSLYAILFAMPIAGWVMSVAAGYAPRLGSWSISLPIPQSKTTSDTAFTVHNTLAIVLIVFVSIHVLAALYHYFFKKDNVLQRML